MMISRQYGRPYDPRIDGSIGQPGRSPNPGGIFGQRPCPSNHFGIFESFWALPEYVERDEVAGSLLNPYDASPDLMPVTPAGRNIRAGTCGAGALGNIDDLLDYLATGSRDEPPPEEPATPVARAPVVTTTRVAMETQPAAQVPQEGKTGRCLFAIAAIAAVGALLYVTVK